MDVWEFCTTCSFADAFPTVDDMAPPPGLDSSATRNNSNRSHRLAGNEDALNDLRERDSLIAKLEEAEREIKILKTERRLYRQEIERLKEARSKVQEDLELGW